VDPISKGELDFDVAQKKIVSDYGRCYSITDGICDFRPYSGFYAKDAELWKEGQDEYEELDLNSRASAGEALYQKEIELVADVYENISLRGDVLDVGGHQGRLRAFLPPDSRYMVVDPYLDVFRGVSENKSLIKAYPCLTMPLNFVCGVAEHLPLRSVSFDTVHMRSVMDHFANPELAMLEAYRVLRKNGTVIVGLYVEGGRDGRVSLYESIKERVKKIASSIGVEKWKDHHVWHPTHKELISLIVSTGFEIDKIYWQKAYRDKVVYIQATKA
jgi:SAM-dependent methyltransferase